MSLYWLLKNSELFAHLGIPKKEGKKGSRETDVASFFFWILDIKLQPVLLPNISKDILCQTRDHLNRYPAFCPGADTRAREEDQRKYAVILPWILSPMLGICGLGSSSLQACRTLWVGLVPSSQKSLRTCCRKSPKLRGALEPPACHRPSRRPLLPMGGKVTSSYVRDADLGLVGGAIWAVRQRRPDVKHYKPHRRWAIGLVTVPAVKCMVCTGTDLTQLNSVTAGGNPYSIYSSVQWAFSPHFMHSCLLLKL